MKKKQPAKKKYSYIPWQEVIALTLVVAVMLFFAFGTSKTVTNSSGYCPPATDELSLCLSVTTNDSRMGWPLDYHHASTATNPDLDELTGITTSSWNGYRLASDAMFFTLISVGLTSAGLAVMHIKKRSFGL